MTPFLRRQGSVYKDTNLISVPGQTVRVSLGALRSGGGVNKRCVFEIRKTRNIFFSLLLL